MNRRRFLSLAPFAATVGLSTSALLPACAQAPKYERIRDVIYRKKGGVALTMDVFKPEKQSGIGVLFMVSGGWFSSHEAINAGFCEPFLKRGQTVFMVVHGSQPKYIIPEIWQDIERATRFVRYNAATYGVDPNRLGVSGGSAGGHLSLMLGARGPAANPEAKDPIDRVSGRVQAVACFYPPTDFLNYGKSGENALLSETLKNFRPAWGLLNPTPEQAATLGKEISPITYADKNTPPTLIIHGDKDLLVPIQQAEAYLARLKELGVENKLIVREGKAHGWPNLVDDIHILAQWFDDHLPAK